MTTDPGAHPACQLGPVLPEAISFEGLCDFHDIIECGPYWNTIEHIVVTLNVPSVPARKIVVRRPYPETRKDVSDGGADLRAGRMQLLLGRSHV